MANYRAVATGNWSSGATWGGGAVPPNGAGHSIYSNTFTITIDANVDVALITNAGIAASFVGGGTSAASGGLFALNNGISVTATTIQAGPSPGALMTLSGSASASVNGAIIGGTASGANCITHSSTGTLTTTGTISSNANTNSHGITVSGNGILNSTGDVASSIGVASGINVSSAGATVTITGNLVAGSGGAAVANASTSTITIIGNITASGTANGFTSPNSGAINRLSGSFIAAANGTAAVYAVKYYLNTTPLAAKTRYALNGTSTYVDYFTADNTGLGPATTDVRTGVSYGGGMVGTCAVPAAGSVALGVPVDATNGTAILTQANIQAALTAQGLTTARAGNLDFLDATVSSRLAPSGTLAVVTTLTNAPASVTPSDIWSHASRTLTSASGPTAVEIRQELDANSTKLADIAAIKAVTDDLDPLTARLANVATTNIVGTLLAQSNS